MNWQEATTGVAAIVLVGAVVVVTIIQLGATWRARMSVAREEAYRTANGLDRRASGGCATSCTTAARRGGPC